jgi:hypothetical protein
MQQQTMSLDSTVNGLAQLSLPDEQWKQVPETEGRYFASNLGRLASNRYRGHDRLGIIKPALDGSGYYRTVFFVGGKYRTVKVHRVIAQTWLSSQPMTPADTVNHKNFVRDDNRVENLEIMSMQDNIRHAWEGGKYGRSIGSINGNSKLTEETVAKIRAEYVPYVTLQRELAAKYGVGRNTVMRVLNGKSWKHTQ